MIIQNMPNDSSLNILQRIAIATATVRKRFGFTRNPNKGKKHPALDNAFAIVKTFLRPPLSCPTRTPRALWYLVLKGADPGGSAIASTSAAQGSNAS